MEVMPQIAAGVPAEEGEEPGGSARERDRFPTNLELAPRLGFRAIDCESFHATSRCQQSDLCPGLPPGMRLYHAGGIWGRPGVCQRSADRFHDTVLVEAVGGDPARHHDHGHSRSGMRGTAGQIEPLEVRAAVGWLEGTIQPAVTGKAVDGAVEHAIAVVYVLGGKPALDLDSHLDVIEPGGRLELLEDGLTVAGIERFPVMMRPEIRSVDQHVERLAAGRCDIGLRVGRGTDIARGVRGWFSLAVDDVELFWGSREKTKL